MIEDPTPEQVAKWRAGEFQHRENLERQRAEHKGMKFLRGLFNGNIPHGYQPRRQGVAKTNASATG